ncbi:diguanylate cyclase domain-containing protein [Rhizobium panacihumi]|uniref:diguanylate cyclase n=1 Tax=Rhizobium panacihumi TaxID=2008450 RepID=UPI003D7BF39D
MFNDTLGRVEGDWCLKEIAFAISNSISRPRDICARYGGEEFAVILPNTCEEDARARAEMALTHIC